MVSFFSKPKPDGPAKDRTDLLTLATHEIGHLLGVDESYAATDASVISLLVQLKSPLGDRCVDLTIYVIEGPHLTIGRLIYRRSLTPRPVDGSRNPTPEVRQLISSLDALLIAEISSFQSPNLNVPVAAPF